MNANWHRLRGSNPRPSVFICGSNFFVSCVKICSILALSVLHCSRFLGKGYVFRPIESAGARSFPLRLNLPKIGVRDEQYKTESESFEPPPASAAPCRSSARRGRNRQEPFSCEHGGRWSGPPLHLRHRAQGASVERRRDEV